MAPPLTEEFFRCVVVRCVYRVRDEAGLPALLDFLYCCDVFLDCRHIYLLRQRVYINIRASVKEKIRELYTLLPKIPRLSGATTVRADTMGAIRNADTE